MLIVSTSVIDDRATNYRFFTKVQLFSDVYYVQQMFAQWTVPTIIDFSRLTVYYIQI